VCVQNHNLLQSLATLSDLYALLVISKAGKVRFLAVRIPFTEQNAEEENWAEEEGRKAETSAEGDQSCQGAD